jgi:hypothetical protein
MKFSLWRETMLGFPTLKFRWQACLLLAMVALIVIALPSLAQACPQCQKALANSAGGVHGNIVRGYFWSILFMLSMPFALIGGFSTYCYWLVRKARRQQGAGVPKHSPPGRAAFKPASI